MLAEADCEGMAGADAVGAELDAGPAYPMSLLQEVQHVALAAALNAYIHTYHAVYISIWYTCCSMLLHQMHPFRSTGAHNERMLSVYYIQFTVMQPLGYMPNVL